MNWESVIVFLDGLLISLPWEAGNLRYIYDISCGWKLSEQESVSWINKVYWASSPIVCSCQNCWLICVFVYSVCTCMHALLHVFMYVCVCVHVCVCLWECVCACVCVCVCAGGRAHACVYVLLYVLFNGHIDKYMFASKSIKRFFYQQNGSGVLL